jgi:ABC-2 type transport system permease protein
MMRFNDIKREAGFVFGHRQFKLTMLVVLLLSSISLWAGFAEMQEQQATIERLLEKDQVERDAVINHQSNYGMVAYYSFHLTYAPPTSLAFAAVGERDVFPWKHRIRMLALEGQIYESDTDNPELAFLGRFDFAFVTSVLLPLFIILLLYDLKAKEREARRFDLLNVTARNSHAIWTSRVIVTLVPLALAVLVPFVAFAVLNGAELIGIVKVCAIVIANIAMWSVIVLVIGAAKRFSQFSATHLASIMLGVWLMTTVVVPVTGHTVINALVDTPEGGDIVLIQREAVNGAWDKPVEETWSAFLKSHPQWANYTEFDPKRDSSFNWKWYYAFQQVGDEMASELSQSYQASALQKDEIASYVAWLSPSLLTQRLLSSAADTDVQAMVHYENSVRHFHASLRDFYYNRMFKAPAFSLESFEQLPTFTPQKLKDSQESTDEN